MGIPSIESAELGRMRARASSGDLRSCEKALYTFHMVDARNARPVTLRRALALAVIALAALLASPGASLAQDPFSDFFGGLFGFKRAPVQRPADEPRVRRIMPHQENRPPTYWRGGEAARSTPKRAVKRSEPSPGAGEAAKRETPEVAATYFVAVMGDTLGILLANGLEETFADKPEIGILRKGKESSGLVRSDFYDWPKAAKDIANGSQKIDVAVMMIGSNDRQSLREGAQSDEPFSAHWRETYAARIDAVMAPFREKKIPVVWVGLPMMKNESFSADMGKLNDLFRVEVAKNDGIYVDLWEALADERGRFNAFGPDINGQIVKLRTADGVHFTEAGALSVAHFVATEIKKLYDERKQPELEAAPDAPAVKAQPPASAAAPSAPLIFRSPEKPLSSEAPALPERPAIGPVQTLTGAPAPAGAPELARRAPASAPAPAGADAQALARHVFIEGGDQSPRPNRADDYSWKPAAP
ncbi:SGNH/GDSL hydrolase family protein [Methylocystis iwaonis]|uniref:DUF459 domain-containing protein n=1 Tax=Methylocystis iwaonis TaxID=2885079 RepID=A0ABM8E8L3_9HYPH|nr:SGNH family hydrolase [Methylocystis iwaonis]BDV34315.1 hypothetical protein SS37A_18440 [Methylocystis iwaonis]